MSIGNTNQIGLPDCKSIFTSRSIQSCTTLLQHHYFHTQFYSSPQVVNPELQLTYDIMLPPITNTRSWNFETKKLLQFSILKSLFKFLQLVALYSKSESRCKTGVSSTYIYMYNQDFEVPLDY